MTTAERILWHHLRGNQVVGAHFRRQQIIAGFIIDFYCHAARLVIELDGAIHHGTAAYDAARDERLEAQGLLVVRITNDQIMTSRQAILAQITDICAERLPTPYQVPLPSQGRGTGGEVPLPARNAGR